MVSNAKVIVAVPVKNEVDRIGTFIAAMARQSRPFDALLLLLNNCSDGTFEACCTSGPAINIEIIQCHLPPKLASAGEARRIALAHALMMCGDGIILTTDADAVPGPDWVAQNLDAIARGADAVCGKACLLPEDRRSLPQRLHQDDTLETTLLDLLDEIDCIIDPDPFDPWPRHQHHSGASIAMRAQILRQAGGAPRVSTGEDRALIARFQNLDARVRHDPTIVVPVSGRLEGRAENGMAATLKRRIGLRDQLTDERLEPTIDFYRRSLGKSRLRAAWQDKSDLANIAADLLVSEATVSSALQAQYFGAAWRMVEAASPVFHRRRVAFADIGREIRQAGQLRDMLRLDATAPGNLYAGHLAVG